MLFLYVLLDHPDHVWFLVRVPYTISLWAMSFWKLCIFPPDHLLLHHPYGSSFGSGGEGALGGKMHNFQNDLAHWEMVYGTRTKNQTWSGWSRRTYKNNIFYEKTNSRLYILPKLSSGPSGSSSAFFQNLKNTRLPSSKCCKIILKSVFDPKTKISPS